MGHFSVVDVVVIRSPLNSKFVAERGLGRRSVHQAGARVVFFAEDA